MVQRYRNNKMASEQPVKKKLRRGAGGGVVDDPETTDETDFIQALTENGVRNDLSALHLSLPVTVNEDDITLNTVNVHLHSTTDAKQQPPAATIYNNHHRNNNNHRTSNSGSVQKPNNSPLSSNINNTSVGFVVGSAFRCGDDSIQPAPDIIINSTRITNNNNTTCLVSAASSLVGGSSRVEISMNHSDDSAAIIIDDRMIIEQEERETLEFQTYLVKQCLCNISESMLQRPFEGHQINDLNGQVRSAMLSEWSTTKILEFLSNLQLLFDVYLKQNNNGYICSKIANICGDLIQNEHNLIEQMISLSETRNKYINYMAARVLSSFLIIAKTNTNNEWLESIVNFLTTENIDYVKMNFALEIIKRVVEWKDIDIHVLEESSTSQQQEPRHHHQDAPGSSTSTSSGFSRGTGDDVKVNINCVSVPYSDPESFDTSAIKGLIIKSLESKWPELINKIHYLILHNNSVQSQTCILTFLALWESTISVKANLSIIEVKPFYAQLEKFVGMLNSTLSPIIWKQLLSLFNEVLCYGSTLALQDMLPVDTCQLAHYIVRSVKDYRLLDSLPYRRSDGLTVNSFVGTIPSTQSTQSNIDRTLLQKMTLLVLKSVAITIKETRSDSSDSSVGSDDYDFFQDMQVIARSIRDVLKKLDQFIKSTLDFHPETPFSRILIHLSSDQDDYMIESMVCALDITTGISFQNVLAPDFVAMLNPVHTFIEFLKVVGHDSDVLLDYLVSNETCFLLYLLRFLKYIRRNWDKFVDGCCDGGGARTNELDNTMTVLIRLKMQINRLVSKDLFPYNINPVLKLLHVCENFYEGSEFS